MIYINDFWKKKSVDLNHYLIADLNHCLKSLYYDPIINYSNFDTILL